MSDQLGDATQSIAHTLTPVRNSAVLIAAYPVHSSSFFSVLFDGSNKT